MRNELTKGYSYTYADGEGSIVFKCLEAFSSGDGWGSIKVTETQHKYIELGHMAVHEGSNIAKECKRYY